MIPRQWQAAHPSYPNPWQMFKSFPSRTLALEDRIQVVMSKEDIQIVLNHEINLFLPNLLVAKEFMIDLVEAIRNSPSPPAIKDIIATFPVAQQDRILRCLGWMLKHGACNLMSL